MNNIPFLLFGHNMQLHYTKKIEIKMLLFDNKGQQ